MSGLFNNAISIAETRETENAKKAAAHAARQAQLREERRLAAQQQRITEQHGTFVQGFVAALEKLMIEGGWKPEAIMAAEPFVEMLMKFDGDLPEIPEPLARLIRPKFAYGVFLAGDRLPSDLMVGQRQDWCVEEVARLNGSTADKKERSLRPKPPAVDFPSTEPVPFCTSQSEGYDSSNVLQLPAAITPKTAKLKRKTANAS